MENLRAVQVRELTAVPGAAKPWSERAFAVAEGERIQVKVLVRRYRVVVGLIVAGFLCLGGLVGLLQTPLYRAKSVIAVQGHNRDFLNIKDFDPTSPARSGDSYVSTQAKLIKTETLAKRVVNRMGLRNEPAFFRTSDTVAKMKSVLGLGGQDWPVEEQAAVETLLGRMTVKPEGDSDLINITVDTPNPELSAKLVNELSTEYIAQEQESRWANAIDVGKWLTAQLEDFRTKLQKSENDLQNYANSASLMFTGDHNSVAEDKLKQIQQDLSRSQADRAEKQSQLETVSASTADSLPRVLDDGPIRDLKTRLAELKRQYAELSSTLMPTHYRVERTKAQITEIEDQLSRERNTVLRRIRNEYDASAKREALLQANYQAQAKVVSDQASRAVRYNVLKREVETNRELYSSMLQKVKEASMLSALRTNSIRVVDGATVSNRRYRPNYIQNLAIALVTGLMVACGVVLVRERANRRIREPGQFAQWRLRELGVIPSARFDPIVRPAFKRLPPGQGERNTELSLTTGVIGETDLDGRLVTWKYKRTLMAECYRSLAVSVASTVPTSTVGRALVVTSPAPRAGKSTTISNLAIALANRALRVLLIDGDLRRPQLHELFSTARENGLADALLSTVPPRTYDLVGLMRTTPIAGLSLMTAGSELDLDPSLLASDRMAAFMARFRLDFDVVLIDAPPLLHLPDARLLAKATDGAVLVCRADQTSTDQVTECARILEDDGVAVLGTVLNDWNPKSVDPNYYRSYYSHYASA